MKDDMRWNIDMNETEHMKDGIQKTRRNGKKHINILQKIGMSIYTDTMLGK